MQAPLLTHRLGVLCLSEQALVRVQLLHPQRRKDGYQAPPQRIPGEMRALPSPLSRPCTCPRGDSDSPISTGSSPGPNDRCACGHLPLGDPTGTPWSTHPCSNLHHYMRVHPVIYGPHLVLWAHLFSPHIRCPMYHPHTLVISSPHYGFCLNLIWVAPDPEEALQSLGRQSRTPVYSAAETTCQTVPLLSVLQSSR